MRLCTEYVLYVHTPSTDAGPHVIEDLFNVPLLTGDSVRIVWGKMINLAPS